MLALRSLGVSSCLRSAEEASPRKHSAQMFILAEFFEFITIPGDEGLKHVAASLGRCPGGLTDLQRGRRGSSGQERC